MASGIMGQLAIDAGPTIPATPQEVVTIAAGIQFATITINIVNLHTSDLAITLAVVPPGSTVSDIETRVEFEMNLPAKSSYAKRALSVQPGTKVYAFAKTAAAVVKAAAVTVHGVEKA